MFNSSNYTIVIILTIFLLAVLYNRNIDYDNFTGVDKYIYQIISKYPSDLDTICKKMIPIERYQREIGIKYTKLGYKKTQLEPALKLRLKKFWLNNQKFKIPEEWPGSRKVISGTSITKNEPYITYMLDLDKYDSNLYRDLNLYIEKVLKKWTNLDNLEHITTYGIREYRRGASLKCHVDNGYTHVISTIINIDQDKSWPLLVYGHDGKKKNIIMDDRNDLVLYESATVVHGRPEPFIGNSYANIFIHFKTKDWDNRVGSALEKKFS